MSQLSLQLDLTEKYYRANWEFARRVVSSDRTKTGDSVISLAERLGSIRAEAPGESLIIMDWSDSTLFMLMCYHCHLFRLTGASPAKYEYRIYLAFRQSFNKVMPLDRIMGYISNLGEMESVVVWDNFLFLLPLIGGLGLPNSISMQSITGLNQLEELASAVSGTYSPIFDPVTCSIDLMVLVQCLRRLEAGEMARLNKISDLVARAPARSKLASEWRDTRAITDKNAFRFTHYGSFVLGRLNGDYGSGLTALSPKIEGDLRRRCLAYLNGLLIITAVHRGITVPRDKWGSIRLMDSPLLKDLRKYCESLGEGNCRYVGLPESGLVISEKIDLGFFSTQQRLSPHYLPPSNL